MRTLTPFVLFGLLTASTAAAQSSDFDIPAHVSRVDGRATIERAEGSEDLERNLTLMEGDRIRTFAGRVEILFSDGTLLHLDRNTVVDFQADDFVRVMEGRARWIVARDARDIVRVDTPAATLELDPGGDYVVAVAPNGDAELAVRRGAGALFNDQGETSLRAGERAVVAAGRAPSQPFYANAANWDDFDRWSDAQYRDHMAAISVRYLPNELHPYGSVFDSYGTWRSHPTHGYVWYPVAEVGWQPYHRGRWHDYPRYGWTWIGHDPWAWPTHHFGRWGFSAGVWFWIPGRRWAPAWVAWASSRGYVGWSPLGWNDHPIYGINVYSPYSAGYPWCGWTFIRDRHFGRHVSPGQTIIGVGVTTIVQNGITPAASSPVPRRAVPRNGVPTGYAVPRGTTLSPSGLSPSGAQPRRTNPGGLAEVPTARPRRIPTDTIRQRVEGRAIDRDAADRGATDRRAPAARTPDGSGRPAGVATRRPAESARAPDDSTRRPSEASRAPREGSSQSPRTARPRGGSEPDDSREIAQPAPPTTAGRPIRRRSGDSVSQPSGAAYPYSASTPRARQPQRDDAPAVSPWRGSTPQQRETFREPRPRQPERSGDAPRMAQPRERTPAPSGGPAPSWRGSSSPRSPARSEPAARPQPAPSRGGAGGGARTSGDSRRPSGDSRRSSTSSSGATGRTAQSRPRGGG